ncbi:hypothetical protein CERSUDRAFT_113872 [Gelatoporia subvermispora B]|uniref:Uncharacterized protein n=1 Tax=Ceriporiopsis subvermispora (strain B) TaxID=914234 RepID=M2R2D9_CERS8|nr:hypothetical protein CERSUDRAFT_113872 [Gelatoporia subvermispora B]
MGRGYVRMLWAHRPAPGACNEVHDLWPPSISKHREAADRIPLSIAVGSPRSCWAVRSATPAACTMRALEGKLVPTERAGEPAPSFYRGHLQCCIHGSRERPIRTTAHDRYPAARALSGRRCPALSASAPPSNVEPSEGRRRRPSVIG